MPISSATVALVGLMALAARARADAWDSSMVQLMVAAGDSSRRLGDVCPGFASAPPGYFKDHGEYGYTGFTYYDFERWPGGTTFDTAPAVCGQGCDLRPDCESFIVIQYTPVCEYYGGLDAPGVVPRENPGWGPVCTYKKPSPQPAATPSPPAALPSASGDAQPSLSGDAQPTASGDPHLLNVKRERFDIRSPGRYDLLTVPRGAEAAAASMRVGAVVASPFGRCGGMFIKELDLSGRWLGEVGSIALSAASNASGAVIQAAGSGPLTPEEFLERVPPTMVKFEHPPEHVSDPTRVNGHSSLLKATFKLGPGVGLQVTWVKELAPPGMADGLWVVLKNLAAAQVPVGGLLGADDHAAASAPDPACGEHNARGQAAHGPLGGVALGEASMDV